MRFFGVVYNDCSKHFLVNAAEKADFTHSTSIPTYSKKLVLAYTH